MAIQVWVFYGPAKLFCTFRIGVFRNWDICTLGDSDYTVFTVLHKCLPLYIRQ